ncbi:MAG TPA: tetratricopeptide repeat protein, partial [Pyrinomonadaceae bacterium]|nr:tetratricopeptide repeat protein [Pyrinomonadaceae bacterium]
MHQLTKWVCLCALLCLASHVALAQSAARNMDRERRIWQELEAVSPASLPGFKAATEAFDREDYAEAARLYQQVMKKAPGFDVVYRRLAASLISQGHAAEGMPLLEKAIEMKRSPENLSSLARYLAYPENEKEGSPVEKERALRLAIEAQARNTENDPSYAVLVAELSLDLNHAQSFRDATKVLVSKHSDLMLTHYYSAVVATMDEDWVKAEDEIKQAESLGLDPRVVRQLLDSGVHNRAMMWRYLRY